MPLTIKLFATCLGTGMAFAFFQAAGELDNTSKAIIGVLVTLVGVLAMLVYKDVVRRIERGESSSKELGHKLDKAIRAFTALTVEIAPERAPEIYRISEAFFKED